jgi:hypothetical protein
VVKKIRLVGMLVFLALVFGAYGVRMIQEGENPTEGLLIGAVVLVSFGLFVRWKLRLDGRRSTWRRAEQERIVGPQSE